MRYYRKTHTMLSRRYWSHIQDLQETNGSPYFPGPFFAMFQNVWFRNFKITKFPIFASLTLQMFKSRKCQILKMSNDNISKAKPDAHMFQQTPVVGFHKITKSYVWKWFGSFLYILKYYYIKQFSQNHTICRNFNISKMQFIRRKYWKPFLNID